MSCTCIGGLYDRTCRVHGPLAPITRREHEHEVAVLKNQVAQLFDRVRRLEVAAGIRREDPKPPPASTP